MPEGHTLHRLAREQTALFAGRPVHVTSPQGRFEAGAAVGDGVWTDLRGATICEVLAPPAVDGLLARLGPDPLRRRADGAAAYARIARSRTAIGALLMDQSVLAGVGNVYRAELLFRSRVSPFRPGRDVDPEL